MMRWIATFAALLLLGGCAQQIEDIDRTQPNRLSKADLDGVWYYMETVTEVPPTSAANFEGETSPLEKIVWRIEEDYLLAYRAYPLNPGADDVDGGFDYDAADYAEAPVAAYPIQSHFDVIRQYSASTGEQTNVIVEDANDRPWYEREFMRVNWSRNDVTNWLFINDWMPPIEATYHVDSEREEERSIYFEREAGELVYFDTPRRVLVEPDLWGCILSLPWYSLSTEDCAPGEIEVVASFARVEPRRDYEPLEYDDRNMSRFGFFRNERYVYDSRRGYLESSRQELLNRHDLWVDSYQRDSDGQLLRNDRGHLVAIPLSEREVRTIPYHASATYPDDELLWDAAELTMAEWNDIGREAAALAKGVDIAEIGDVFVLCHNPVEAGDHAACGGEGFSYRPGDLRHSTLHWVESEQLMGPLGYGPSATDPETGEIVSGRAYVYGAGINRYAEYGVDVIRFMNGAVQPDELINADHVRQEVRRRTRGTVDLNRLSPTLREQPVRGVEGRGRQERLIERSVRRENLPTFDRGAVFARLESARETGLSRIPANGEFSRALGTLTGFEFEQLEGEARDRLDPTQWLSPTHLQAYQRRRRTAMRNSFDFADMIDPNLVGMARAYEGRDDYDQIWRELRADIFRAVALHEVGHTVGLRHNFQATYDSMNYFDSYWDLRQETLIAPESMADLYTLNAVSDAQYSGRMLEYAYSSIMDYGLDFNTDLQGLGRYDRAAFLFGYTAGSELAASDDDCEIDDPTGSGRCLHGRPGFVEVYAKTASELGAAGDILTDRDELGQRFDDLTTPNVPYLERWHYTTVMRSFPSVADAFDRRLVRLDDYLDGRNGDDGLVRVPYLFCGDEWTEALASCQVYDGGADPFEAMQAIIADYRAYYYFVNFKRDRLGWDVFDAFYRYFAYTFLPVSNIFQNWYLAPEGADSTQDEYYWWAIHTGFNFLAEVIATPPYGTFCTGTDGDLFHLSDEPGLDPSLASDYYLQVYCDSEAPFYEVAQGDGRARFSSYDVDAGYDFAYQSLEAGHYWATLAAFWALIDPEAFVLGTDADLGTFAISFYDFFADEIHALVNAALVEEYSVFSPVLEVTDESGENPTGTLHYPVPSAVWDGSAYINPENGQGMDNPLGPAGPRSALCAPCDSSRECLGSTGFTGGTYCQPIAEGSDFYCLQDCTNDEADCPDGFTCDEFANCVPTGGVCERSACSADNPNGSCSTGSVCLDGECTGVWPVVQSDTTFSLMDDMVYYGMLYSTASYSTRYNDQLNVFKVGTAEEITPGEGFEVATFTDPFSGDVYGAIVEQCQGGDEDTSARCDFGLDETGGGTQMVYIGQRLTRAYDTALRAYYEYNGDDEELDTQLRREWSRASFELENHVSKINVIRAVYRIFGQVY